MKEEKKEPRIYKIPVQGSLGLLALGAVGIREWRKAREAAKEDNSKEEDKQS